MTTILVTTDLSTNSKAGIRFALQYAAQTPCKLVFYNIIELMTPTGWSIGDAIDFVQKTGETGKTQLESFLKDIFKETEITPSSYDYDVEIGTDVDNLIINYAQNIHADFICMCTRGAGAMKKFIGTNASTLVSTSPIPVLIVPQNYHTKPITKIGYASDFENIEKELTAVSLFATALDAKVEVYHFYYQLHKTDNKENFEAIKAKYQTELVAFYVPTLHLEQSLVENIQHVAKNQRPSLLVMFTKHKENWFERFFFASKTAEMTYDVTVPLLAIRK